MEGALGSIDPAAAAELIAAGATYLDVRETVEFDSGHAPGALHIPLDELEARLGEIPDGPLVVGCRSGRRSADAVELLARLGREAVNLTGGLQAWAAAGLEVVDASGAAGVVL